MNKEIIKELSARGANIIRFVDISRLPEKQTQGFTKAVLLCISLSRKFISDIKEDLPLENNEFSDQEDVVDYLGDWLAEFFRQKGYQAYSQSDKNNAESGNFDKATKTANLPHKTIASLSGLGFIGKNSLLITKDFGSALCMCTVLTDAPIETEDVPIISSKCGNCQICKNICPAKAIHGKEWTPGIERELLIDVFTCKKCLKCMANCTWTLKYVRQEVNE